MFTSHDMDHMNNRLPLKLLSAAALASLLAACGSSSVSNAPLESQAVDGYIVDADVFCDGILSGSTKAAGRFSCPAGTQVSKISGGFDVGIDDVATTGEFPFTGVLKAPASEPFVTPMTTLSVALAQTGQSSDTALDLSAYQSAVSSVAQTLGISQEALSGNPVTNLEAAKSNAKIHQVISAFAPNVAAYEAATLAFVDVIKDTASVGGEFNLTSDVRTTLASVNEKLQASSPDLVLATVDFEQIALNVAAGNELIDAAESPNRVATESQRVSVGLAPVTIDRSDATVRLFNEDKQLMEQLTIDGFESPIQSDGFYTARLYSGLTKVDYDNDVFQFNQNINDARLTVAFEVKSANGGDNRSMSFVSSDVVVSAVKSRSDSLSISMLSDLSTFEVLGTDSNGVVTAAVIETNGETFNSDGDTLTIDLEKINRQLADLGFEDILKTSGDYVVTLVVSGMRINERDGNSVTEAKQFTVNTGKGEITGNGFRGYVSVIR